MCGYVEWDLHTGRKNRPIVGFWEAFYFGNTGALRTKKKKIHRQTRNNHENWDFFFFRYYVYHVLFRAVMAQNSSQTLTVGVCIIVYADCLGEGQRWCCCCWQMGVLWFLQTVPRNRFPDLYHWCSLFSGIVWRS